MNGLWLTIIWQIVQMVLENLLKNLGNPSRQLAAPFVYGNDQIRALSEQIAKAEPRFKVACLEAVLPKLFDDLANLLRESGSLATINYGRLAQIVLEHVVSLVKCQFFSAQALDEKEEAAIQGKILQCGVAAFVGWSMDRDLNKAVQSFLNCFLGSLGGLNPGGDDGQGNLNLEPTKRC